MLVASAACAGVLWIPEKMADPVHPAPRPQNDASTDTLSDARKDNQEYAAILSYFAHKPLSRWFRTPAGESNAPSHDRASSAALSMPATPVAPPSYWMSGPEPLTDPAAATAHSLALGDVSRDGRDDLVFLSLLGAMAVEDYVSEIYVATQRADGSLGAAVRVGDSGNSFSRQLKIADLDRDGFNEIITTTVDGVMILRSNADGTFTPHTTPAGDPYDILVTDVDRDGYLDVLVDSSDRSATVVHGDGQAAFDRVSTLPLHTSGTRATGDVTGDGLDDLILGNVLDGLMEDSLIYPALPYGGYGAPTVLSLPLGSSPAVSFVVGDFNGDGRGDLVMNQVGRDANLRLYTQDAEGKLRAPVEIARYSASGPMIATDLNRDGRTDLAIAHTAWSYVGYYLQANGVLMPETLIDAYQSQGRETYFAAGDLNHDGCGDFAIARSSQPPMLLFGKGCAPRGRIAACCSRPLAVERSPVAVAGLASPPTRPRSGGMATSTDTGVARDALSRLERDAQRGRVASRRFPRSSNRAYLLTADP